MIKSSLVMSYSSMKIIRYIKRLKHKNLLLLKSATISVRTKKNGINGFLISSSSIKDSKITFVSKSAFLKEHNNPQRKQQWPSSILKCAAVV